MKQDRDETGKPQGAKTDSRGTTRRRRRGFRLLAAILGPLLFLGAAEMALRVFGFGHPTSFLLPASMDDRSVLIPNHRFTWRYFGAEQSREPVAFAIPIPKPRDTVRIFLFGESAAYGDPQPEFGLARTLEALLSLRYPGIRFEVVNAAITAINSHVIRSIAHDCSGASGDIWVLYMGNNEVIGPFGAGTVFGPRAPPLPLIRSSLAIKATRTGQLLDAAARRVQRRPDDKREWGGLLMFVENQVRSDDPRMDAVYHHFERNLADILDTAQRTGVGVVVSSVAVNLRDCAPFASARRPGLDDSTASALQTYHQRGREALERGAYAEALSSLQQAARIDDSVADVQFMIGRCLLALGDEGQARLHFIRARDEDALRFRCDTVLNETLRRLAVQRNGRRVAFVDSVTALAQQSPDHLPGREFFYDHVHLTFEGNYLLAATIADAVAGLLPSKVQVRATPQASWPSIEACADRLAFTDRNRAAAASLMLGRLCDPPFPSRWNHQEQADYLHRIALQFAPGISPLGLKPAIDATRRALQIAPDDGALHLQLAGLLEESGALPDAEAAAMQAVTSLPHDVAGWCRLGRIRAQQRRYDDAIEAFEHAIRGDPEDVWAHYLIAMALAESGRSDLAEAAFRRAISIKPHFGPAYLGLASLQDAAGLTEEADANVRRALANRVLRPEALGQLAKVCQKREWYDEAATNYADALIRSPADPMLYINAGQCLEALGRSQEALHHYQEAVQLAPDLGEARFLLGVALGRDGNTTEALRQFEEAVRLMPDLPEAHLNMGIARVRAGRGAEAMQSFQEVLRLNPGNPLAEQHIRALQAVAKGSAAAAGAAHVAGGAD